MKNFETLDEILMEKCFSFVLRKDDNYKEVIENNLLVLAEVWQSELPLRPYRYNVVNEYDNVVIVQMSDKGKIKVNC